jgi:hypothetical protein
MASCVHDAAAGGAMPPDLKQRDQPLSYPFVLRPETETRAEAVVRLSLTSPPKFSIKSLRSVAFLGGFRLPLGPRGNLSYSPPFGPINFVDLVLFFLK